MTVEEIRAKKKELGYTNAQLAEASGVPLGTVNKILSGKTESPRRETLQALANGLYKDPNYSYGLNSISGIDLAPETIDYLLSTEYRKKAQEANMVRESVAAYGEKTVWDYDRLPEKSRVELIRGKFFEMAAPSVVHQEIVGSLYISFSQWIKGKNGTCKAFISPIDVKLPCKDDTIVQPDIIVVCDSEKITPKRIEGAPDFVAEIVSPSSKATDYIIKAALYREAGVREYWIIDILKKQILRYFFEDDMDVYVGPLTGKLGVKIYSEELVIDLDELSEIL